MTPSLGEHKVQNQGHNADLIKSQYLVLILVLILHQHYQPLGKMWPGFSRSMVTVKCTFDNYDVTCQNQAFFTKIGL